MHAVYTPGYSAARFEWDPPKRANALERHKVDFVDACRVFDGPALTAIDARRDYGEIRFITLGDVDGRVLVVVWPRRADAIRLISARKANAKEIATFKAGSR